MEQKVLAQPTGEEHEALEQPQCKHHWLIEPPAGPTSRGYCKHCGEERFFINSTAEWVWDGQTTKDFLSGAERSRASNTEDSWQESN